MFGRKNCIFTKIIAIIILQAFLFTQAGLAAPGYARNLRPPEVTEAGAVGLGALAGDMGRENISAAEATGTPEKALEEFRRLYRESRVIILGDVNADYDGINNGRYSDTKVFSELLPAWGISPKLLVDIINTDFMKRAFNVVIDLKALTDLLPKNYPVLSRTKKMKLLRETLPMARFRVQGTDGWRSDVVAKRSKNPNVLCPDNLREYTFAYGWGVRRLLEQTGRISQGERIKIVVGYDPRDPERLLTNAAIEGLQLAGIDVIDAGISATPATPIFMLYRGAHGAIEITASHNRGREPYDQSLGQNGTKLFLGFQGLKLFLEDELGADKEDGEEMGLTALYYSVHDQNLTLLAKKNGWEKGGLEYANEEAHEMLERFMSEPINSWAMNPDGTEAKKPLDERTMLVVDCGKGAYSSRITKDENGVPIKPTKGLGIVARRFQALGAYVEEPILCRDFGDGCVNYKSGAGFIEGFHRRDIIERADVETGELAGFKALERLFELGSVNRQAVERDEKRVIGILLDADGDRYIRLDYDPWRDCLVISSGDEASYHQAEYLLNREKSPFRDSQGNSVFNGARFIFTVESDLNGVISATQMLKLDGDVRGVGDKWVLLQAILEYVASYIEAVKERLGEKADSFKDRIEDIEDDLRSLGRHTKDGQEVYISSRRIIEAAGKIDRLRQDAGISQDVIDNQMCVPGRSRFAIGSEETGHAITMMVITTKAGRRMLVYFGNGFKSAVNDVLATTSLYPPGSANPRSHIDFISNPFSRGHKENYYTYFTNRALFRRGSEAFNGLRDIWMAQIKESFAKRDREVKVEDSVKAEEPDMLFLEIKQREKGQWKVIGSVFCRNSGTELKTTVYVRGRLEDRGVLGEVVAAARNYICLAMKDRSTPEVMAQIAMVRVLSDTGPMPKNQLIEKLHHADSENPVFTYLDLNAVIAQSRDKEAIIGGTTPPDNPILKLGPRGQWFIDNFANASAAGANGIQLAPARQAGVERTVAAKEALLKGKLTRPDIYGITVKQNAASRLIAKIEGEIARGQIPLSDNGIFKDYVGRNIRFGDVPNGYIHIIAPNIIVLIEEEGTLKGDLSGLMNLQMLVRRMIEKVVNDTRRDLSSQERAELAEQSFLRFKSFNIWTAGSGSREKELAMESKATITLPNGNTFIANTIQQGAVLTDFTGGDLAEFIAGWQPGEELDPDDEGIVIQNPTDRVDLITNENIAQQIMESCRKYGITMVGTVQDLDAMTDELAQSLGWIVFNKNTGRVVDFVEKPTLEELRARVPEGCDVASSWHLFGITQRMMRRMEDRYAQLYLNHMDLSNDLQEAVLTIARNTANGTINQGASINAWMAKGRKNKRLKSAGGNYTDEEWKAVWRAAQEIFPEGLGFVDSGEASLFIDTGAVNTLFDLIKEFARETQLGEILRRKYGVQLINGAIIVNSKLSPNVKVHPGAVIVNVTAEEGEIAGVATNVAAKRIVVDESSWASSVHRPKGALTAGNHQLLVEWQLRIDGKKQSIEIVTDVRESLKKAGKYEELLFHDAEGRPLSMADLERLLDVAGRIRQDGKIEKAVAEAAAAGFKEEFGQALPENIDELAVTDAQIQQLVNQGVVASDWTQVFVSPGANMGRIKNVLIEGPVYIKGNTVINQATIGFSVIEEGANISAGAYVGHALVGKDAQISASTIRGAGGLCAKDNTPNIVTIEEGAVVAANSTVLTGNFRAGWQQYQGFLSFAKSEPTATIIRKGARLTNTYINNSEIGEEVISSGSYVELSHIWKETWLYPGSKIVFSNVGGKIAADQPMYAYGYLLFPPQQNGQASLNFGAVITVGRTTTKDGKEITFPSPVLFMPGPRGAVTANWYGAANTKRGYLASTDDMDGMSKGCAVVGLGAVIGHGGNVYVEKGEPSAQESWEDIMKRDDMTLIGPFSEVSEDGAIIGRLPGFTSVGPRGMSRSSWDVADLLESPDGQERIVNVVATIRQIMADEWTPDHDQIVEGLIRDSLVMTEDMLAKETDPKKQGILASGAERLQAHLNSGNWLMYNGRFNDDLEAMVLPGGFEQAVLGEAMAQPEPVSQRQEGAFTAEAAQARQSLCENIQAQLLPSQIDQLKAAKVDIADGAVVYTDADYDLTNIEARARISGTVYLGGNTLVRGTVSDSVVVGGIVGSEASIVSSVVANHNRPGQLTQAITGSASFSYIRNASVPKNATVARSSVIADDGDSCILEEGEKPTFISNSELRNVTAQQGVTIIDVHARTDRSVQPFNIPAAAMVTDIPADFPVGARKAIKAAITKTFEPIETWVDVKRAVFKEGCQVINVADAANVDFGEGTTTKGAIQITNVITEGEIRANVNLANGYLAKGAVAGGSMNGFFMPPHAANGHTNSQAENYYVLNHAWGCLQPGAEIPEDFTSAHTDEEGYVWGVFALPNSGSNVGSGTAINNAVVVNGFTQINSEAGRLDGKFIFTALDAFIHDMSQAESNYAPAGSQDDKGASYEWVDRGRIIFKAINSGVDYGARINAAMTFENRVSPNPLYDALLKHDVFATEVINGKTTFVDPWYKLTVNRKTVWANDRLLAACQEQGVDLLPREVSIDEAQAALQQAQDQVLAQNVKTKLGVETLAAAVIDINADRREIISETLRSSWRFDLVLGAVSSDELQAVMAQHPNIKFVLIINNTDTITDFSGMSALGIDQYPPITIVLNSIVDINEAIRQHLESV